MDELKDLYNFAVGMGWDPKAFLLVAGALFIGRKFLEPNIINVMTAVDKRRLGIIRLGLFVGSAVLGWLAQVGFHKEIVYSVNFVYGCGDTILGWVIYSMADSLVGGRFSKEGGSDAPSNPAV